MNKIKQFLGKSRVISFLSLGLLVLGIGCTTRAMYSRLAQANSDYYVSDTIRSASIITASAAERKKVTTKSIAAMKPVQLYSNPKGNTDLYPKYPVVGDNIGSLTIPALKRRLPIIEGTGEKELKKGVGHFIKSVLPGQNDNSVFSGHRDTVFRQLGKLNKGDLLIVKTRAGTFTYKVSSTRIVHQDDKTVIVPTKNAVLTLTTCYPFYFIGSAPDRYIVSAALTESKYTTITR